MSTTPDAVSEAEHLAINVAIHIPCDRFQDAITAFVQGSSLAYCTTLDTRGDDSVAVVPRWSPETFSTGEKHLWELLRSLADGDLRGLADRGSNGNRAALVAIVRDVMGVGQ